MSDIMMYRLKSCQICRGDLALDADEWRCLQCGRYYYVEPALKTALESTVASPAETAQFRNGPVIQRRHPRQPGGMASNNLNPLIEARESREREWKARNEAVIHYLDRGYKVSEISARTGLSPRNIRSVRDRLAGAIAG